MRLWATFATFATLAGSLALGQSARAAEITVYLNQATAGRWNEGYSDFTIAGP